MIRRWIYTWIYCLESWHVVFEAGWRGLKSGGQCKRREKQVLMTATRLGWLGLASCHLLTGREIEIELNWRRANFQLRVPIDPYACGSIFDSAGSDPFPFEQPLWRVCQKALVVPLATVFTHYMDVEVWFIHLNPFDWYIELLRFGFVRANMMKIEYGSVHLSSLGRIALAHEPNAVLC